MLIFKMCQNVHSKLYQLVLCWIQWINRLLKIIYKNQRVRWVKMIFKNRHVREIYKKFVKSEFYFFIGWNCGGENIICWPRNILVDPVTIHFTYNVQWTEEKAKCRIKRWCLAWRGSNTDMLLILPPTTSIGPPFVSFSQT